MEKILSELVDAITIKQNKIIDSVIADGAYYNNKIFNFYHLEEEFNQ